MESEAINFAWRKSGRSAQGNCVEVRRAVGGGVEVRDSKNPDGARLSFTPAEWTAFVEGVKDGQFEL